MAKSNQQYWKDRMDEILAYVDQSDINFFDELQSIYQEFYRETNKELFAFYSKYAKDNKITLQEAKKRLMREDLSDYKATAEQYFKQAEKDPELLKRLNTMYTAAKATRLEALNFHIEWLMGRLNGKLQMSFKTYLEQTAKYVWKKVVFGNSPSTLSPHILKEILGRPWNGINYSQSLWGNTDKLAEDLRKIFLMGFKKGLGPAEMARLLRKKYNVQRAQAETIIRTDGTNVINNATAERYRQAGLTKYQFWAHIDSRTTETCKDLHRDIFLLEDYQPGMNAPPMHYGCRSSIVPDDEELGMEEDFQGNTKRKNEEYAKRKSK